MLFQHLFISSSTVNLISYILLSRTQTIQLQRALTFHKAAYDVSITNLQGIRSAQISVDNRRALSDHQSYLRISETADYWH